MPLNHLPPVLYELGPALSTHSANYRQVAFESPSKANTQSRHTSLRDKRSPNPRRELAGQASGMTRSTSPRVAVYITIRCNYARRLSLPIAWHNTAADSSSGSRSSFISIHPKCPSEISPQVGLAMSQS